MCAQGNARGAFCLAQKPSQARTQCRVRLSQDYCARKVPKQFSHTLSHLRPARENVAAEDRSSVAATRLLYDRMCRRRERCQCVRAPCTCVASRRRMAG